MDYAHFVATRRADWEEVDALLQRRGRRLLSELDYDELERLAARHRAVVADFAWARTHFPGSDAERELRALAFAGHRLFTPPEPPLSARLLQFFRVGYPARFRASLGLLRVALALFLGGMVVGLVVTTLSEDSASLFIGAEGVDQIRSGQIWTDQLEDSQAGALLAVRIFVNNIGVALLAWAGGALFGVGTLYAVSFNGAMVGSMVAICLRYGLLDRLLAFIPAHGMLELFLITVAGAAGLELANGLLRPGEVSRGAAFTTSAGRSVELVGGTVPWFVLLGLVEGFLSPLMGIPTPVKAGLGLTLLGVFLVYVFAPAPRIPR